MKLSRVTIAGLGMIGGSIAKALRDKLNFSDITAIDTDEQALYAALKEGIISVGLTAPDSSIHASDAVFICTPVSQTIRCINELSSFVRDDCIFTDTSSTKEEIMRFINEMTHPPCFIGGHPMAGTEKSGYANSYAHLFENAYYVLTPCASSPPEAIKALSDIIEGIGAIPVIMTAKEHDEATGGISHLPHVIAAALVNLIRDLDSGSGKMQTLAAGGFRDITRIASSNPGMWKNIVLSNKSHILGLIERYKGMLKDFETMLHDGNSEGIFGFFDSARRFRDTVSDKAQGLIRPLYTIIVDVLDRPGTIGEIATMLGRYDINIKNINVANSREYEQGCLIISLPDMASVNFAFDLLSNAGYKVYKKR